MYGLVQRATRYPYEASVILKATSATSLCDIGADAIGGPHYLFPTVSLANESHALTTFQILSAIFLDN